MSFKAISQFVKQQFEAGNLFTKIIIIQLCLYALVLVFKILSLLPFVPTDFFFSFLNNFVALPPYISQIGLRFYTLLTYQFVHLDFFHVFVNVIALFFFAKVLEEFYSIKQRFPLFILGGVFSGLFALLINSLFGFKNLYPIYGASGSIMALMGALVFISPNYMFRFFGMFKLALKYIAGLLFALNFLLLFFSQESSSPAVHVGGLLFGYAFAYLLGKGIDLSLPFNVLIDKILLHLKTPKYNFNKKNNVSQSTTVTNDFDLNTILDKISKLGYASLTKEEKDFLFKKSKE